MYPAPLQSDSKLFLANLVEENTSMDMKVTMFLVSAKYINASVVGLVSPRGEKSKTAIKSNNNVHTFLQCNNLVGLDIVEEPFQSNYFARQTTQL